VINWGKTLRRHLKSWLLLLLGTSIYIPFFLLAIIVQMPLASALFLGAFLVYCYLVYRHVYKGALPKYPAVPPEGRTDIYFPRTDIPRPIHKDIRRYPEFFKGKKKRKIERMEKEKRKK
jgi:hypothetical protein